MVINQYGAIGDILFLEPMFRHFWYHNNEKPTVPVHDHLMWIAEYIDSANFVPKSQYAMDYDSMKVNHTKYLPCRFANQIIRELAADDHHDYENMMLDKYRLAFLDPMIWKTLRFQFDTGKCAALMKELDVFPGAKYVLVNEHCQAGKVEINPDTNLRIIRMREIPGYTVLDWAPIMLMAQENHHVSTSTFYILQALTDLKGKVFIYPRPNEDGLRGISLLEPDFKYTPII